MMGTLLSDTVKNPKLNVNSNSSVLSARSYPMENPQRSSRFLNSINSIKLCSKQTNEAQKDQTQVKALLVNENVIPPSKGIKRPSKLLSLKYQSQSSLGEPIRNSSSPKRVHFINTITILSKEDEPRKIEIVKQDTKDNDHELIVKVEEKSKESKDVMFVELIKNYDDSSEEELRVDKNTVTKEEFGVEYFDIFLTRSELAYHKYLMCAPVSSLFLRNPIIVGGSHSNLKISCNIGHVHIAKDYIDLNPPINVMTRMQYNWIMRKQFEPREDPEGIRGISNFTRRIKGMHIFLGNFTYVSDFMIVEDISSIIDPRLSQVVLGKPFVEVSNMTHDSSIGVVKFTIKDNEIAYKMPHKIEQYNSLLNLEKKHTKSVYFRNKEDKRRGIFYVIFDKKKLWSS
ncbi:hypothetical protein Tco_1304290 [Tanacetum coccineum]